MSNDYIHGYSEQECKRLVEQAEVLAGSVFGGFDFEPHQNVLESGCAVGAELLYLADRHPHLHLTGIDRDPGQVEAARQVCAAHRERVDFAVADATDLPFANASFDLAICIWLLEHVPDPVAILREACRVLEPGGTLYVVEVDNDTFGTDPAHPAVIDWWARYSAFQAANGGNPVAGQHLVRWAREAGCTNIQVERIRPVDTRVEPARREELWNYATRLLLSAGPSLGASEAETQACRAALAAVRAEGGHIVYHGTRLICSPPESSA